MISIVLKDAGFQAEFGRKIQAAKNPTALLLNSGREVANQLKKWFRSKDSSEPNKLSERRSHFWLQVAQSVNQPEVENPTTISVTISDPRFAQKVFGGTIRPKNAEALTIPVEEKAYGRTAATFEAETGLKLFIVKIGGTKANGLENALLAVADPADPKHITVEYVLAKSVYQQPDTDALPPQSLLESAALNRAQKVLDRQLAEEK